MTTESPRFRKTSLSAEIEVVAVRFTSMLAIEIVRQNSAELKQSPLPPAFPNIVADFPHEVFFIWFHELPGNYRALMQVYGTGRGLAQKEFIRI